jgi:hypothetical protein
MQRDAFTSPASAEYMIFPHFPQVERLIFMLPIVPM